MAGERFEVTSGNATLVGEQWRGEGVPIVMLHAGVADRRSWREVAARLTPPVLAYDRRGFGDTPPSAEPFDHFDDLVAVLDALTDGPVWLVGNSMGGAVVLDASLRIPDRIAGQVLIAPAVYGEPEPPEEAIDAGTAAILEQLGAAGDAGDIAEQLRLHAWLWLDGPAGPEGRVGGAARELALDMNERVLRHDAPDDAGEGDADAWSRLEEVTVPTTVVWGDRDTPVLIQVCRTVAARVPGARTHVLAGVAHLPSLEAPDELAAVLQASTPGR